MEKSNLKLSLTVQETANALGLTAKSVYSLVFRRKIPFAKVGNRVLIPVDVLKNFLDSKVIRPIEGKERKKKGE